MLEEYLRRVVSGEDLSEVDTVEAMRIIMSGQATPAQIAGFLIALRLKGETIPEISGFARVMREMATHIEADDSVIDTCGTGGDRSSTFNISTAAALVATGMGIKVAKHGNHGVSSSSGSADVLKELGVNLDADVETISRCIREAGIGFLFAPRLHAAMKHAIGPRREMGVRTVFNILGPLTNPAGAKRQLLGVYDASLTEKLAGVLANLGAERAMVVHGADGLDEISVSSETLISEVSSGEVRTVTITPEEMGFERSSVDDLVVSSPEEGAGALKAVLSGEKGPKRDIVLANAAAAAVVAGLVDALSDGVAAARESIDTGNASRALDKLIEVSNS